MDKAQMHGVVGSVKVPRLDDGAPAIPLSPAQLDVVEAIEWLVVPDAVNLSMKLASNPTVTCLLRVNSPLSLWLYSSSEWSSVKHPPGGETVIVWDAREPSADDLGSVPPYIPGSDGRRLYLRASSSGTIDHWPVEAGDRVFIKLTEARSGQFTRADMEDYEANHPDEYADTVRKAGGVEQLRDNGIKWFLNQGMGDLARVTPSMRTAIRERQIEWAREYAAGAALLERLVAEMKAAAPPDLNDTARRAIQPRGDLVRNQHEVVMTYVRGDFAKPNGVARRLGYHPKHDYPPSVVPFGARFTGACDRKRGRLSPSAWGRMRDDLEYSVSGVAVVENGGADGVGLRVVFRVDWIGVVMSLRGHTVELGPAVLVCFHDLDDDKVTPWVMLEHWDFDGEQASRAWFDARFGDAMADDDAPEARVKYKAAINEALDVLIPLTRAVHDG